MLAYLSANPTARLRDVADEVGVTDRTVATIVADLADAGYLAKRRDGLRNRYRVREVLPLRHPRHRHHTVGELIRFLEEPSTDGALPKSPPS